MILTVPIGPLVWGLSALFRALRSDGKPAAGAAGKARGSQLTVGPTVTVVLYIVFLALPLSFTGMILVGDRIGSAPLTFLAFVLGIFLPFALPHWLAWRVLVPLRWRRAAQVCLWLACHTEEGGRQGAILLADAACQPHWRPGRGRMSPWMTLALALKAEVEEDPERADRLLEGIAKRSGKLPNRFLCSQGLELVTWPVARRGDWTRVRRRAELGGGRGVWLLRRLAISHLEGPPPAAVLWLLWALAPQRSRTLPFVRAALAARPGEAQAPTVDVVDVMPPAAWAEGAPLAHLRLLARGAAGRPVRAAELEALARLWEEALTGQGHARILSRGMELGVQGVAQAAAALEAGLMADLAALADVAEGPWRASPGDGLAGTLRSRQIEGLMALLEEETKGFPSAGGIARELDSPAVEYDRWQRFRRHLDRLEVAGGQEALITAWFNGLRLVACNWPVYLERAYGRDMGSACLVMHRWSAEMARRLRDEEIQRVSGGNVARYKVGA